VYEMNRECLDSWTCHRRHSQCSPLRLHREEASASHRLPHGLQATIHPPRRSSLTSTHCGSTSDWIVSLGRCTRAAPCGTLAKLVRWCISKIEARANTHSHKRDDFRRTIASQPYLRMEEHSAYLDSALPAGKAAAPRPAMLHLLARRWPSSRASIFTIR
jgi:hypothetical protein